MARDETPGMVQEQGRDEATKAVPGADGAGVGGAAAQCDFCGGLTAVVYCRADSARLCLPCDRHVHGANTVSTRHARAPLCSSCRAAPAAFRRAARFLCSDCDFERHRGGGDGDGDGAGVRSEPLHDRATVEGYTGCPSIGELAAILGAAGECEKAAGDGWWSSWEEPQVLSLDDVIVPTSSCHGLQPLLTPSSPENGGSPDGELDGEVLQQLGVLAKSETAVASYLGAEPASDHQLPSWASLEYTFGHGDFCTEAGHDHEAANTAVPSFEHESWMSTDCNEPTAARKMEIAREQAPLRSSAEPWLSSFVEISEICPGMSCSSNGVDNGSHDPATPTMLTQALPKKGVYDIAYPDRGMVISRYKEKRKNRRFGKQIRYESRKTRADGRSRIKGRFTKLN
ncbi:hypothetical protein GUJ93_ZPchr0013g35241 [Zizania palustris]|uniref:CCT domain-containing protein n=1 Tax=Zizania palustris TaxID=103762 RepID=A0A8J5WXQ0_ZIZPA|nr:hypothetical protein GUJ93_ZPchr0013g35241 [Zizania palustris]